MNLKKLHQIILENNRLRRSLTELYPNTYKRYEERAIQDKTIADAMVDISRDNIDQARDNTLDAYMVGIYGGDEVYNHDKFLAAKAKRDVLIKLGAVGTKRSEKRGRGINLARAARLRKKELPAPVRQITGS